MNLSTISSTLDNGVPKSIFSWFDYLLFIGVLGFSVLIGIYFWCCGSKQNTTAEYLLGGKNMKIVPIAISFIASHVSGTTLLAIPADIYKYGSNFWWLCVSLALVCLITSYIFLPVLYDLQLTSMFEYLNLRFNKKVQVLASFLFLMSVVLYSTVIIYVPALAFSQVSGVNVHYVTPILCGICIFYTTIGGLKTVVWTDTFQFVGIFGSIIGIVVMGIIAVGGIEDVWNIAVAGKRLDIFDFRLNPTLRDGFWSIIIGGTFHWLTIVFCHQGSMQKFWSLPTLSHAKTTLVVYYFGMVVTLSLCVLIGITMYAKYAGCDPLLTKQVKRTDQLLPYFVMDIAGNVPGLPGIFTAGIFSAGLSSLSATLNTMSGIIYEDFVSSFISPHISQERTTNILKLLVVICGVISTALILVVENLGGIFPLITSLHGVFAGPLFGLYILGMLFPVGNSKGAWFGGISGLIIMSWIVFSNQYYKSRGLLIDATKVSTTMKCSFSTHIISNITVIDEEPFVLYRISFWYYTMIGTLIVVIIGLIISWFTKSDKSHISPNLISPLTRYLLFKCKRKLNMPYDDEDVIEALKKIRVNSEYGDTVYNTS